jgi:MFS family permease
MSPPRAVRPFLLFLPFCFGVFIAADDQTVVVTVLPEVMRDLRVAAGELDRAAWAVTGYLIGYTAAMPLMGRLSDRIGHRSAFLTALGVFVLGSAAVALSPDLPRLFSGGQPEFSWMVGARVFQAVGGGAVIPISLAAAGVLVPEERRPVAYGLVGASAEAGGVIGPLWGGTITHALSWEWAFWLNIPLALIVAVLVLKTPPGNRNPAKLDLAGGAFFAAALVLLTIALSRAGDPDGVLAWALPATGVAVMGVVWRQFRSDEPLMPRVVLARLNFRAAACAHFLVGAGLIIAMVSLPLMANTLLGDSPLEGGLRLLRMTIAVGAGALAGGVAVQKLGPRRPSALGISLCFAGFLLMSRWTLEIRDPWMTLHLAVLGLGFGLLVAPVAHSALFNVADSQRGAASALLTVARMVGMTAGLAALTAWGTVRFAGLVGGTPAFSADPGVQEQILAQAEQAGMTVFRGFFLTAAIISAAVVVPAWLMTRRTSPANKDTR